jgi:Reverse transcriptase (RNA-dependent DNA polymerase)
VFTLDCRNAFNSMTRASMLQPVAEVLPEALQYISHLYTRTPPQILVALADGSVEVVHSQRGAQQGDPFGPMLFSFGLLAAQRQFQAVQVPLGCYCIAYLDDMGITTLQLDRRSAHSVKRAC